MNYVTKSVEHYCRTADEYYQRHPELNSLHHKPFGNLVETTNTLAKLAPLLEGLRLGRKMTVLDFGAGTCWLSRFLTLLDCRCICLEPSATALQLGRQLYEAWPSLDAPLEPPQFLVFNGRRIDLPDDSVDRIICFEAFHHVPNDQDALAEMFRVLKPGGFAGFAEPGEHHSEHPFSQSEMRNNDILELDVVMHDIWEKARAVGFVDIRFRLYCSPGNEMSLQERDNLLDGEIPRHIQQHLSASMKDCSVFFLHKGALELDSRGIVGLAGKVEIQRSPAEVRAGQPFEVELRCTNTGVARWLGPDAYKGAGSVRLGWHRYDTSLKLLEFDAGRHPLLEEVMPGETRDVTVSLGPLPRGEYIIAFDLKAEPITWFEVLGAVLPQARIRVV